MSTFSYALTIKQKNNEIQRKRNEYEHDMKTYCTKGDSKMNCCFIRHVDNIFAELKATTSSAGLPLNDEDSTTKQEDGWRKINTLRHYGVRDGTTLIVVSGRRGSRATEAGGSNLGYDNSEGVVRNVHGRTSDC